MKVKSVFDMYSDPSHAWLKVHITMLDKLNLTNKISSFSYQHGADIFLEEDQDAPLFAKKYEEVFGKKIAKINHHNSDKASRIRNYKHYTFAKSCIK